MDLDSDGIILATGATLTICTFAFFAVGAPASSGRGLTVAVGGGAGSKCVDGLGLGGVDEGERGGQAARHDIHLRLHGEVSGWSWKGIAGLGW